MYTTRITSIATNALSISTDVSVDIYEQVGTMNIKRNTVELSIPGSFSEFTEELNEMVRSELANEGLLGS